MQENLITFKISYTCEESFLEYITQYNSMLRFTYNRMFEAPHISYKDMTDLQNTLNNCELMKSWLKTSAMKNASALINLATETGNTKPIIFGGKKLFLQRCNNEISKEEFQLKRLVPLMSVGQADYHGNRLFQIIDTNTVLFKPDRNHHYTLKLNSVGRKRTKELEKLIELQNECILPITFKVDLEFVYITFDYNYLKTNTYPVKKNRVFALDLNPNSIGWSIVDWCDEFEYNIVKSGTFSLKPLNDYRHSMSVSSDSAISKYITNKRKYEIIQLAYQLFTLCKHYSCEMFVIEDLIMPSKDNKKGKNYNKAVNNEWCRRRLVQQLKKHFYGSNTIFKEVLPHYNSYIGNLLFRKHTLPDECLASIEIGRRGYEFINQYILKRKPEKQIIMFPDLELVKSQLFQSLEELNIDVPNKDSWKDILSKVKESEVRYRFSTSEARLLHSEGLFSKFYKKRYLLIYEYI